VLPADAPGARRQAELLDDTLDPDRFEITIANGADEEGAPGLLARARRLRDLVRRESPDLMHVHGGASDTLARLVGASLGVPVIHTPRGWRFEDDGRGRLSSVLSRGAERVLRALTAGLLCRSPSDAAAARRHGLARRDRIHLIPPAVHAEAFRDLPDRLGARLELGLPADALVAAMIAPLEPPHDPLTFVKAGAFLPLRDPPGRLLLAGEGSLLTPCLDLALETGLEDTVVCPGAIDRRRALAAADVIVLATRSRDCPGILLEALAAGLPVVASDVPGCRALLAGGRGRLVPAGDAPATGRAIVEAFADPRDRARFPDALDLDAWVHRLEAIYEATARRP
jgi:glycosyltransferase involved in cell wall biosynthesis